MDRLNKGDWIGSEQGIARVIASVDVFAEEFSSEYRADKNEVGDYLHTLVLYKVLCDHDGVLRSRWLTTYNNRMGVSKATSNDLETVSRLRYEQADRFAKFLRYNASAPIRHDYVAWLNVPEDWTEALAAHIATFEVNETSTYKELFEHMLIEAPSLDSVSVHREYARSTNLLRVVLQNDNLQRLGRRARLTGVSATVVGRRMVSV